MSAAGLRSIGMPSKADRAGVGPLKAADEIEESALARAVRPDHADDLAGPDGDRLVLQRDQAPEGFGEIARLEKRRLALTPLDCSQRLTPVASQAGSLYL